MFKKILTGAATIITALSVVPAFAAPGNSGSVLDLPGQATGHAPVFLGTATDPVTKKVVEGYAFFSHKPGHGGGGGAPSRSSCYAFLASGAKWKTTEPWIVNTANTEGLTNDFVFGNLAADIQKWEDAAGVNIIGDGSVTSTPLVADTVSPDGRNEVYFADIDDSGVIGVTIVWGVFSGNPRWRELVEWDQVYDDVSFSWSNNGISTSTMDFENIATHELGHTMGLGHPDGSCTEETMYAYADFGETKKRDLNAGDIAGAAALY